MKEKKKNVKKPRSILRHSRVFSCVRVLIEQQYNFGETDKRFTCV